jgi:hypothetical protein
MIMKKIAMRQRIANKLEGSLLPSVINELKMKSRNLKYTIKGSGLKGEVSGLTKDNLGGMLWTLKARHVHVVSGIFL